METTLQKAKQLASRPYTITFELEELSDGSPVYFASVRELPGCHGQGARQAHAVIDVRMAMVDYIDHLLRHGKTVPEPMAAATTAAPKLFFVAFADEARNVAVLPETISVGKSFDLVPA